MHSTHKTIIIAVSLIFNVTDDSMERQLPTEQRRYFCKIVLYLVKNSKVPTLHWGDVVFISNLTVRVSSLACELMSEAKRGNASHICVGTDTSWTGPSCIRC